MRVAWTCSALLSLAFVLAGPAPGQGAPPPAAASKPYEDVIRLHAAGLSDDFIVRKIAREGAVYALTTDDIIACKKSGLPELVIEAMLKTSPKPSATPPPPPAPVPAAPVPPPVPAAAVPPVPVPSPVAAPAPVAFPDRTFGGLVRRAPGVVLFKYPWEAGTLSFRDGALAWTDASDPAKNVVVPAADLTEQFLVCPRETDFEGACWEWGVKTASGEYRFRDEAWERTPSGKPAEIWGLVKAAMPSLHDARYRTSKKK